MRKISRVLFAICLILLSVSSFGQDIQQVYQTAVDETKTLV